MSEPILSPEAVEQINRKFQEKDEQITALTAQNEAFQMALQNARTIVFESGVDDVLWKAVDDALFSLISQTPAEALERAKRDAEERQRAEAFITGVRLDLGYYGRSTTPLGFAIGERLDGFDNFRKGAGR